MTDDEFEEPVRIESGTDIEAQEAQEAHKRLDGLVAAWKSGEQALASLEAARIMSHAATRQLLACMYSLAPQMLLGAKLGTILRDDIEDLFEQSERTRAWHPKDNFDVVLTYALGFSRDNASKKSNWHTALMQAEKESVPFEEEAFLTWINAVGGEEKARRPDKREPFDIDGFGESIPEEGDLFEVRLPAAEQLPGGIALVLAKARRREGDRCFLQLIDVISGKGTISAIAAKLKRRTERETLKEMLRLQHERADEEKRQQELDEYGYDPPKRKRAKRGRNIRPGKFRGRARNSPPVTAFVNDNASPSEPAPSGSDQ